MTEVNLMIKSRALIGLVVLSSIISSASADESMQYSQKKLPNGDVQTIYSSSDGAKVESIQHADGSVETTSLAPDGSKSVTIQHKDGSVDSHMTVPKDATEKADTAS